VKEVKVVGVPFIEIKDCPFCGGKASVKTFKKEAKYFINCNDCKCTTDIQDTIYEAIQIWNRRAPEPGGEEVE
jgi:Lar family restriction alleviation protein